VVEKLHLDDDPEFSRPRGGGLPGVGAIRRLVSQLFAGGEASEETTEGLTRVQQDTIKAVREATRARRVGVTYVIDVSFTSKDAAKAARIADAIAEAYLLEQLEARYETAKRASDWLSERLGGLSDQVQASERAVSEYRARFGLVDTGGDTIDKQQVSEINAQLVLARAKTAETRAKYEQTQRLASGGGNTAAVAEVLQSQVIASLRTQEAEVARKEADLSTQYGPRHPTILNVRAELADIRRAIHNEVERIITNLRNEYEVAQKRESSLQESLDKLTGVASINDEARIKLRDLEREAEANRSLYQSFLQRFKETREQTTLETTDSRVISPALRPERASYPQTSVFLGLALFLGLGVGISAAFLMEYLESGFTTAEQVEADLNLPVLAMLPRLSTSEYDPERKGGTVLSYVATKPLSRFGEGIRSARVAISLSDVDQPPRLVLVTSSVPGEGKSTIASSIAVSASASGIKTLLIDGDMRHPSTSKLFGLEKSRGLVDLLSGTAQAGEVFRGFNNGSLIVLPAGAGTKNSPDLLASQRMRQFLETARSSYDLVIIDTPPVTAVVDSLVVIPHTDKVLFVLEWENTARDIVARAMSVLGESRASVAGVVMNKVELDRMRHRESYYKYYSGKYGYGKYYSN
ncbi:MAG: polysaccharide biosynthesis tyrosine autokinase, partial [Hyphomicrobiaceae bacterium]